MTTATTSAVERVIAERKAAGSGALIGYLPIGFPDLATSIDAAVALVENGVDVVEIGLPYSDPLMDGLVIQRATQSPESVFVGGAIREVHRLETCRIWHPP